MSEVRTFNIGAESFQEQPFAFGGTQYVLVEPSGAASSAHTERILKLSKPNLETMKPTSTEGISSAEYPFVAACLFRVNEGKREPVTEEQVRALPDRVVKECYRWLDSFGKKAEGDAAKNTFGGITPGSA